VSRVSKRFIVGLALRLTLLAAACDSPVGPSQQAPTAIEQPATPTVAAPEPTQQDVGQAASPTAESLGATPASEATDAAVVASPTPEEDEPSPTEVTATSTGQEMTALQALAV